MIIVRTGAVSVLHRVVEHGDTLYLSGVTASDLTASMKGQTEEITRKIDAVLAAKSSSKDKLLTTTIFITDMKLKDEMNTVWTTWLSAAHMPCRATIGVSDLGPGVLIEITAIAAK